jgi:hypothetical protein
MRELPQIAPLPDEKDEPEPDTDDEYVKAWWPQGGLGANDGERG